MWYPTAVNFRRKPIKFCSSNRDFIVLVSYEWFVSYDRGKTKKLVIFCTYMVDFCRPGHIIYISYVCVYIHCMVLLCSFGCILFTGSL